MDSKLMEKTVSNIFTNLLNAETHLTSAKVQAVAETALNYAFILCDTYKKLTGTTGEPEIVSPQGLSDTCTCTCTDEKCAEVTVEYKKEEVKKELPKVKKVAAVEVAKKEEEVIFDELKDADKDEEVLQPVKRPRGRPKGFSPKKKQTLR